MKILHSFPVLLAGALLCLGSATASAQAPAPPPTQFTAQSLADMKTLNQLLEEIQLQQKTIADNQALIDQKLAAVTETVRTARIFVSRGGGRK
jgi:hypothetical protein